MGIHTEPPPVAQILLEHGADPNASYISWDVLYTSGPSVEEFQLLISVEFSEMAVRLLPLSVYSMISEAKPLFSPSDLKFHSGLSFIGQ